MSEKAKGEPCATAPSVTNSAVQLVTGSTADTTTSSARIWRREPRPGETETPLFNAIWGVVKHWEIQTETGSWYSATGNDVCGIIDSIASAPSELQATLRGLVEKMEHKQFTRWKDGIDIDVCTTDCLRCQFEAALNGVAGKDEGSK